MAKLSQERISEIIAAYQEIGTYSGTAKATGTSPATVKKYVTILKDLPVNPRPVVEFTGKIKDFTEIDFPSKIIQWVTLTESEEKELHQLQEEI